ncbi:MAG: methyltransferase domain-containing protein [Clostridia bacterium]|nr:methyltransferase domain-containing protein [Clostridia bacterium]
MNTMWSSRVQTAEMLYLSRSLRFADAFAGLYKNAFRLEEMREILEVGCGPGALAQALSRWYPQARVGGVDRDSGFVAYAREKAPALDFTEGDALALPFEDGRFDATISNTVSEHVEPEGFFGEQRRVLRPGGVCLVLSARRGIRQIAPCLAEETPFEADIWRRVDARVTEAHRSSGVAAYPMDERQLPQTMARCGFRAISTSYVAVNLTPDNPDCPRETALRIFEENRRNDLDVAGFLPEIAGDLVTADEAAELQRLINERHDRRVALYEAGEKQWDVTLALTMVARGIK